MAPSFAEIPEFVIKDEVASSVSTKVSKDGLMAMQLYLDLLIEDGIKRVVEEKRTEFPREKGAEFAKGKGVEFIEEADVQRCIIPFLLEFG